jgi:molybdopterin-guanine dinucleotide biosynthesis protein A
MPVTSPVNGLILAGGKSIRMGKDKGTIMWHGKDQRIHMADVLKPLCNAVYISCRKDQQHEIENGSYEIITDAYDNAGPLGAIVSAFAFNENFAWLVIACDIPLLNFESITQLLQERDPDCIATAFESPHDHLPEPLATIWEPGSYRVLLSSLKNNELSPRNVLLNNKVKIVTSKNNTALLNVNTAEDYKRVKQLLSSK